MNTQPATKTLLETTVEGFMARADAKLARSAAEKGFADLASYKAFLNARIAAKRAARAARPQ